jgi:ABC-2 type transport system ATP-binding protein
MSIQVTDLFKIYGTQKALNGISFDVQPGEILGFLGPNGAGKSTTMKILTGFIPQTSGSAKICGLETSENPILTRRKIGYLPELNPLYTDMFIKEYLLFSAGLMGITGKEANSKVEEMLGKTGLSPERNKKIQQLSKGYKQRVGLAAALLHDPEVLILDEPTSGLDPNQVLEIRNLIKETGKNKTVIFSTHIMQEVEAMCSRVVIINKGNIVANDTVQSLQSRMEAEVFIIVELKNEINKNQILSIKGVSSCEQNGLVYQIRAKHDIREALAELVSKENNLILSMNKELVSLEAVFQNLTR